MPLSLFGHQPKVHFQDKIGTSSAYDHTFGGKPEDFGLRFVNIRLPLHLIYRLDLSDPSVPIELPGIDTLPLLYPFHYDSNCCYRVLSNIEVELVSPDGNGYLSPPWDAPKSFPRSDTSFTRKPYDPTVAEDALRWKGIFGWKELSRKEKDRALELVQQMTDLSIEDMPDDDWTYEQVIHNMYESPFSQGRPLGSCMNCEARDMSVIALQDEPVPRELIWPDKYVQTIWQECESCHCISVTNQCT